MIKINKPNKQILSELSEHASEVAFAVADNIMSSLLDKIPFAENEEYVSDPVPFLFCGHRNKMLFRWSKHAESNTKEHELLFEVEKTLFTEGEVTIVFPNGEEVTMFRDHMIVPKNSKYIKLYK